MGLGAEDGNIPHGGLLVEFAEAVLGEDEARLESARWRLAATLGAAALSDAAAVVGLFNAIDRIADATGIPLEPEKAAASAEFRALLGIDEFDTGKD